MQTDTICLGILRSGPATGYVIKSVLEGPLNQIYNLSFGSIYPALSKLTKEKYVTVKQHAQDKKPDKKVYTITKKGISYFEETLLEESGKYVRSGNYGDQVKSEFAMLLLFSKSLPKQNIKLILDERILYAQQQLNLITYEGLGYIIDIQNRPGNTGFPEVIETEIRCVDANTALELQQNFEEREKQL